MELTDDKIKEFVFCCIIGNPNIVLTENGKAVRKTFAEVAAKEDHFSIKITEDTLWIILTGYKKKESNLGNSAFELLLEIARSRDRGINTKDLAIATNQDPRSITGRIKKLEPLTSSVQMIYKGHVVKLLKLQKFAKTENIVKPYVNIRDYLPKIVEIVKNSKNGVRQIIDLKRELKLDNDKRLSKSFIAAINWLNERGHLKKVLVVSPTNTAVKIRCVKYIRDFVVEGKPTDFDYETDSCDDENMDFDKAAVAEEDAYEGLDSFNATNLLQDEGLILEEKSNLETAKFLVNRFYSVQNQTYDLADESGTQGVSTMQVINKLTGPDYRRAFTKSSELYVKNVGKNDKHCNGYEIVRVYDFEGKKKFYRFFTGENFAKLTGDNSSNSDTSFRPIAVQEKDLQFLNSGSFVALSSTLRFIKREGRDYFFWNGELKVPPSANAPTKGRKRKIEDETLVNLANEEPQATRRKLSKNGTALEANHEVLIDDNHASSTGNLNASQKTDSKTINVGGFSANSLRSLWRQRAILEVVRKAGGVIYLREQFFEDVSRYMGSATILDKKTVRGDVTLMIQCNKLQDRIEPKTGRRIIYLTDVDAHKIDDYVVKEKDSKKAHFKDVIHNTDIYFFDQTEKNRFHRGVKSAERVRQFQSRSKDQSKVGSGDQTTRAIDAVSQIKKSGKQRKTTKVTVSTHSNENTRRLHEGNKSPAPKLRTTFHMGNRDGSRALLMAVVISKSIKNEIAWDKITRLFPSNSLENLKKQWTIRRVKMGHHGWRAHVDKWRKILVSGIKKEETTLLEAEKLDLPKLIGLWMAAEDNPSRSPVLLYRDYAENRRHYTFVKDSNYPAPKVGLSMSSMVQRETSLLKKVYMYEQENIVESEELKLEDKVKVIVRSLLFDNSVAMRKDIKMLRGLSRETVDKIVMDMAKEKQIHLSGSKLEATNLIQEILQNKGNYGKFEQSGAYRIKLEEMLGARNGIVISEEISDVASWSFIDLIARRKVILDSLSVSTNDQPLSYTTRRFGVSSLTPSLIVTPHGKKLFEKFKEVPIPLHESNSRLWIDSAGSIRKDVWKNLISMIVKETLFNPGIGHPRLLENCCEIISRQEMKEICSWLLQKGILYQTPFNGYSVTHRWYMLME